MNLPIQYRFRKWLLRPAVRQLGLFISVGGALSGLSWVMKASSGADGALLWKIRIVGMILFVAPIVITIWAARIRDLAPDFLTRISPDYFERDGLCFLFLVEKSQSRARMVLCYQNRFEKPCEANVFIGPTPIALGDLAGLPNFQFRAFTSIM